jgi:hypothetical protein
MISKDYIAKQPVERQKLLKEIHEIIIANDKTVTATVEPMMGKEMIMYKGKGMMKYALASVKNSMTLHVLPMYGSEKLINKYKALLVKANFQKGCINFNNEEEMPLEIVKQLIMDCSGIDLVKIREEYLKSKKAKEKK